MLSAFWPNVMLQSRTVKQLDEAIKGHSGSIGCRNRPVRVSIGSFSVRHCCVVMHEPRTPPGRFCFSTQTGIGVPQTTQGGTNRRWQALWKLLVTSLHLRRVSIYCNCITENYTSYHRTICIYASLTSVLRLGLRNFIRTLSHPGERFTLFICW